MASRFAASRSTSAGSPRVEALLADADWIRALAARLAGDRVRADDIGQDAWLEAWRRGPADGGELRRWMPAVIRNLVRKARRGDARRRARELRVARSEVEPSAHEVVERFATQHAVASAVLELPDDVRRAVLLRYYEGLPLRAVAQRLGVAPSTASGRVERGLALLRERLEKPLGGGRRNLAVWLLPLCGRGARRSSLAIGPVAAAAVLAVAAASIAVIASLARGDRAARGAGSEGSAAEVAAPEGLASIGGERPAEVGAAGPRIPVAGPVDRVAIATNALLGALELSVRGDSGEPTAGVVARVEPSGGDGAQRAARAVVTGGAGVARLALPAGAYRIDLDRGPSARVEVEAERVTSADMSLPRGPSAEGVVVDAEGRPVPFAEVWLSPTAAETFALDRAVQSFADVRPAAVADGAGRFRLPTLGAARTIGARARGFAPSADAALELEGLLHVGLRLVLPGPGGCVRGRVVAADGSPAAGAVVVLDAAGGAPRNHAVRALADADGRFAFESVAPGEPRLEVHAPGHSSWRDRVEVEAGETAEVLVSLTTGFAAFGTVTDESGEPLAGALVRAGKRRWTELPDSRHGVETTSAADGAFRLEGLGPRAAWLVVDAGEAGRCEELLLGEEGDELFRELRLDPGLELAGRAVEEAGAPIAGCTVLASREGDWRERAAVTGADGGFAFGACEPAPYALRVEEHGTATDAAVHARPGAGAVLVVVPSERRPSAQVAGTLVDACGRPLRAAGIALTRPGEDECVHVAAAAEVFGRFRSAGIVPGRYSIAVQVDGSPAFRLEGPRTLAAGRVLELGLVCQPTPARVELVPGAEAGPLATLELLDATGRVVLALDPASSPLALPVALSLAEGEHTLRARAAGREPAEIRFHATAGETAVVPVALRDAPQ